MKSEEIQRACRLGDVDLLKKSIESYPEGLNELDTKLGWAPLYRTVICGHAEASSLLLKNLADPNIQNRLGETPLHQAADNNQLKIAAMLLKHKANPNLQQNDGDTPLHHAALKGHIKVVRLLLKHSADPNVQNSIYGKTPLHLAAEAGHLQVVQALVCGKANCSVKDKSGKTPLELAKSQEIANVLSDPPVFENPVAEVVVTEEIKEQSPKFAQELQESSASSWAESVLEPECEKVSLTRGSLMPSQCRSFSFGGDLSRNSLYQWLSSVRLEFLFEPLHDNGYDELRIILEQMKSNFPISLENLKEIGISKPGHRKRLLALLEEETTKKERKSVKKPNYSSSFVCCTAPTATPGEFFLPNLEEWLENLHLGHLERLFVSSGYDDLDHLLFLMKSSYPVDDQVLKEEVGVEKIGYRHRILAKLKEDSSFRFNHKRNLSQSDIIDKEVNQTACELCQIM